MSHLLVTPILLPLVASALMMLFNERRLRLKRVLALVTMLLLFGNAVALAFLVNGAAGSGSGGPLVYLIGDWPAPFGIVLVADRLSALMLILASILGFASLAYALARWDQAGPRFHALFLLLMMGVNGAFLTGDIFNLFVFFEVLLAASYGLALHGSGTARVKAGLHYVAINVATSLLFLIGVALIYGTAGTLNMADLAAHVPLVAPEDLMLLEAGAAILGIAFLVKAGMWPLSFWLPTTYSAAAPPVAAIFAILSKVGIYVILRLSALLFGEEAGPASRFADDWLLYAGMATIAYGTIGILAARTLSRVAGYYILVSSGTMLAAIGTGSTAVIAGGLLYLVSSVLATGAFYLIIEPVERGQFDDETGVISEPVFEDEYTGALIEEGQEDEIGTVIPATIAVLGGGFIFCALLLSGLPPLSGFISKFAIVDALIRAGDGLSGPIWALITLIMLSGIAALVALTRAGIDLLWTPNDRPHPPLRLLELLPIGMLLVVCVALMLWAGEMMTMMERTARALDEPQLYTNAVRFAQRAVDRSVLP